MHGTGKRKEKPISERAGRSKKFKIEVVERKPHAQSNSEQEKFVACPICNKTVLVYRINDHLDECERKTAQESILFRLLFITFNNSEICFTFFFL